MIKSLIIIFLLLFCGSVFGIDVATPKIQEIKATETLWVFLLKLPASFEAQVFYGLVGSGIVGALSSWLWKWAKGEAAGVGHITLRYGLGQVLWLIGSSIGAIATVGFMTPAGEFFGWLSVLWTGALAGFGGEVKTEKKVWTDEERAANAAKGP